MRILMVAARCHPFMGGIETHIQEVGPRLVARGHTVDVLTTDPSGQWPVQETVRGMNVRRVPAWPKHHDLYVAPGIFAAINHGSFGPMAGSRDGAGHERTARSGVAEAS
jgi:hypothetical protein